MDLPDKTYEIIYADPPWQYKDRALAGERGAGCKYKIMDIKDIQALPVPRIAAENSVLFLWATFPLIDEALTTLAGWGFMYKTAAFVWVKLNKRQPTPFWGMGNWTRANAEVCLLGIKGNPKRVNAGVHQVIMTPREEHSKKPDEARRRIVQLLGDRPRIELFARQTAAGWDSWGDEL